MKKYNIKIYGINTEEKDILETYFRKYKIDNNVDYYADKAESDKLEKDDQTNILSVFVDSIVDKKVMDLFPNLSLIATRSTGYDNIDLDEAKKRNIIVCNVPSYGECTVAEYTFALILMLSRKIHLSINEYAKLGIVKNANIRGFDLSGKTIGIIGTGKIGRKVMSIAKGFGMNILAYDTNPDKEIEKIVGLQYTDLADLFKKSDIVTLHIPYTEKTRHLINSEAFSLMKKTALIINTSRGGIIDTNALVEALNNKVIAGAGLDVIEEENIIKDETAFIMSSKTDNHNLCTIIADHVLMKMPNVIITPHNAYNTDEALGRILDITAQNISAWINEKPINIVN